MITFSILLVVTILSLIVVFGGLAVGGTVLTILASDVIVAVGIIWGIIYLIRKAKK